MKALVAYGPHDYRFEKHYPVPKAMDGDIIIKVEGCGICAGDVKAKHGATRFWGNNGEKSYIKAPVIPGHEFIGTIVEMSNSMKSDLKIGDRVVSEQIVPCWR